MKEKIYIDCERCGEQLEVNHFIDNCTQFKNGTLCKRCTRVRNFDDDNPILYPINKAT